MKKARATTIGIGLAALTALAVHSVQATVTDDLVRQRSARNEDVQPGKWHADLEKARA